VIIKIDFEKAFDTIEHHAILVILRCKGFPQPVIRMMKEVLSSGCFSVLVNGVPRNNFACKRGVRQGDPLSPLLYTLGGDLLQSIVNLALGEGLLRLPIPLDGGFPIVQYADDTIIVLLAEDDQLLLFKKLLNKYAGYTGLKVNYHKSSSISINLSPTRG
jgi:hypothetical protein